tara:strand:- start:2547 stop:3101 length:555 start_codon:yes stop_codon:yes gene_type:complete
MAYPEQSNQGFMPMYNGQQQMQPGTGPLSNAAGAAPGMQWNNLGQVQSNISNAYNAPLSPAAMQMQELGKSTMVPSKFGTNASMPSEQGQNTKWGWGGVGGKAATGLAGLQTVGGLYMANEARKLGAADLDFRKQSFNDQYASQRSLVNDQLFDRQRRRNLESGMAPDAAGSAADDYVKNRGVA